MNYLKGREEKYHKTYPCKSIKSFLIMMIIMSIVLSFVIYKTGWSASYLAFIAFYTLVAYLDSMVVDCKKENKCELCPKNKNQGKQDEK